MKFAAGIEGIATGPIEAIVIGEYGWGDYNDNHSVPPEKQGVVLTWAEARPMLDYEWNQSYGAPECHAITAYTASQVIVVATHAGATGLVTVPRNPEPHTPDMIGGG